MEVTSATGVIPPSLPAKKSGNSENAVARASRVFCNGTLLDAVQRAKLFEDSKTFVDMPLREEPEVVLAAFAKLERREDPDVLRSFINTYFLPPGDELKSWTPPDFKEMPPRLEAISDAALRKWALALNSLWPSLGRIQDKAVALAPQRHTALVRRYGMVIPGGRFRETYYWDTYWIVRGLLVCDMKDTARGVVENLLDDVRNFGFVPNGGRIYYLDRSQPPLLTEMVLAVHEAAPDKCWLASVLPLLEREYLFWMHPKGGRLVTVPAKSAHALNVFHSASAHPRPESYTEDVYTAASAQEKLGRKPQEVYHALRAATESGWDFSSRWLAAGTGGTADLETINTSAVVPVDLNCMLYKMELGLSRIHSELHVGDLPSRASSFYAKAAARRACAIQEILWVEADGSYRDFRLDAGIPSAVVSLSDYAAPAWAGLSCTSSHIAKAMLASLQKSGLIQAGGVSTTTMCSGQQWDAPNAWAPIELMLIEGLDSLGHFPEAKDLANEIASAWLHSNIEAWMSAGVMFEKYDAGRPGWSGAGGEYHPQIGFGWSNGVALVLLDRRYRDSPAAKQALPIRSSL
mmetsp:Transcript_61311/g.109208  ORF Transcript_61311/g.109208 Transcript_61311/m.109208 type:complete len:576 (+) Transcript_61311:68-1795(+)